MLSLHVQEPYASFMKNGQKKVEWRLGKERYFLLWKWEKIQINEMKFTVIDVRKYSSFREMLEFEWIRNVIPDAKNLQEAVDVYFRFYSTEDERKHGVAAIEVMQ